LLDSLLQEKMSFACVVRISKVVRSLSNIQAKNEIHPFSSFSSLQFSTSKFSNSFLLRPCFIPSIRPLSTSFVRDSKANISKSLQIIKSRPVNKKTQKTQGKGAKSKDEWSVVGYSAADSFDILGLREALREQDVYTVVTSEDLEANCLAATNKYSQSDSDNEKTKDIFFFKEGCVVFWNVPELERSSVLKFLRPYCQERIEESIIYEESEMMNFKMSGTEKAHLEKGVINIVDDSDLLVKYTFSDAISASVKLGSWEAALEKIIDSIEFIAEDMRRSAKVKIHEDFVLQKTGEILELRHLLNLSSDLLDTPDFYWDREDLEHLFGATCSHLAVSKRTRVVNEKLGHCLEIIEMINNHLRHEHSSRLEWIIIILIFIEIVFEVFHLYLNHQYQEQESVVVPVNSSS